MSDFYSPGIVPVAGVNYNSPRYGNDCSAFVTYCWGIPRQNTATFITKMNNKTYKKRKNAQASSPGDAFLQKGHIIMLYEHVKAGPGV